MRCAPTPPWRAACEPSCVPAAVPGCPDAGVGHIVTVAMVHPSVAGFGCRVVDRAGLPGPAGPVPSCHRVPVRGPYGCPTCGQEASAAADFWAHRQAGCKAKAEAASEAAAPVPDPRTEGDVFAALPNHLYVVERTAGGGAFCVGDAVSARLSRCREDGNVRGVAVELPDGQIRLVVWPLVAVPKPGFCIATLLGRISNTARSSQRSVLLQPPAHIFWGFNYPNTFSWFVVWERGGKPGTVRSLPQA